MTWLLVIQALASVFMCGVAWFVQVVHYPLFARVGADGYSGYQEAHMRLTTRVVFPPMVVELICAIAVLIWLPAGVPMWAAWLGIALAVGLWISTGAVQVPAHDVLRSGFNATAHRRLVRTSWIRTAAWSARAVLAVWMLTLL